MGLPSILWSIRSALKLRVFRLWFQSLGSGSLNMKCHSNSARAHRGAPSLASGRVQGNSARHLFLHIFLYTVWEEQMQYHARNGLVTLVDLADLMTLPFTPFAVVELPSPSGFVRLRTARYMPPPTILILSLLPTC